MRFLARVYVRLKETVNDPQGLTVVRSLRSLGFSSVESVRVGKYLEVSLEASDQNQAVAEVQKMGDQLLANPVIEEFFFDLEEMVPFKRS